MADKSSAVGELAGQAVAGTILPFVIAIIIERIYTAIKKKPMANVSILLWVLWILSNISAFYGMLLNAAAKV